jgi:alkylmercury lyase
MNQRGARRKEQRELPIAAETERGLVDPAAAGLTDAEAAVRRAAFQWIRSGVAVDAAELAERTRLDGRTVEEAVRSLVRKGEAVADDAGRVVASAGLSLVPARHKLRLAEGEFHTWCAIDAVGIPAALGADALASTACPTCGRPIELVFQEGRAPRDADLRAWLPRQDCCTSVVDELCPDMNLFCTEAHLEEWRRRAGDPAGMMLSLQETEELGRQWWGDLA